MSKYRQDNEHSNFTDTYAAGLVDFIRGTSSKPITLAIQGEWGSGKSFLMKSIQKELCGKDSQFKGVEINAWEHSMLTTPEGTVFHIIEELVTSIDPNNKETKVAWGRYAKRAGNALFRGVREGLKIIPYAGIAIEACGVPEDPFKPGDDSEPATPMSLKELKDALKKAVKKIGKRIVVFIDDLDLLKPQVAVDILELLKNIFDLENFVFMLAIDYSVVVKGLEPKLGKLTNENEREFRAFFDKIVQVPVTLPSGRLQEYLSEEVHNCLVEIEYIIPGTEEAECLSKAIKKIVAWSVGKKPRFVKRFINSLLLHKSLSNHITDEDYCIESLEGKIVYLAIVAIQVCYPKVFRLITLNQGFTDWSDGSLSQLGVAVEPKEDSCTDTRMEYDVVLETICNEDPYLLQHYDDIKRLIKLIKEQIEGHPNGQSAINQTQMQAIIKRLEVTNIKIR